MKLKKGLSLMLAGIMVLSFMSLTVFADEGLPDSDGIITLGKSMTVAYEDVKSVEAPIKLEGDATLTVTGTTEPDLYDNFDVGSQADDYYFIAYTVDGDSITYKNSDILGKKYDLFMGGHPVVIEEGKTTGAVPTNFLAGDIVGDGIINIYDLSAVVSYFGTETLTDAKNDYAKYDLNRDGVIDSKDVAYVLVSWDK